jgi:hypothetical protein
LAVAAVAALALAPARSNAAPAPRGPPLESPLYGPPYRRGIAVDIAVGLALCQPALVHGGLCGPRGGGPPRPGFGARLGAGWRFNHHWHLSGAYIRQGHRPGGSFSAGASDGGMVAVRGIVPLAIPRVTDSRVDLGFELGVGWSQRVLTRVGAPSRLSSNGAVLRPALIFEGWVVADLALGLEFATQINLHWQHCVDGNCQTAPGSWVVGELQHRWVDGFTIAVRATGLVFFRP